jgi:hypothetical protein
VVSAVFQTLQPYSANIWREKNKSNLSLKAFCQHVEQEFIEGSSIAPCLYAQAIHIVSDTEMTAGGEARYPIDEAFNWQPTRFGQQASVLSTIN